MNVFEDLVIELQQENLLESTVMDRPDGLLPSELPPPVIKERFPEHVDTDPIHVTDEPAAADEPVVPPVSAAAAVTDTQPAKSGQEYFHKKAAAEISSLQMVEHLITGVEREYMEIVPKPFDDFNAKKALSTFLSPDASVSPEEHAKAEFNLVQETEAWCSALAARDREVTAFALRRFVEGSRPALSSQALLALGRFYRNLPYSESVRAKFDFVITRLFSRPSGNEKRVCLFNRQEMIGHINTLYSDWSSIPMYDADDDGKVSLTAMSFVDLAKEAASVSAFDELIESDFFGRLRMFKESINELFYAPDVTASAIECNIQIGNVYVDLIDKERRKFDNDSILSKYSDHDSEISEITGKSLNIGDLLTQLSQGDELAAEKTSEEGIHSTRPASRPRPASYELSVKRKPSIIDGLKTSASSVNKWYLIFAGVMLAAAVGLYIWGNYAEGEKPSSAGVRAVSIESTVLKDHVKNAKVSGDTFYAEVLPSWDALPKEKRQEFLQKAFALAKENGCLRITLLGANGKNVGFASATRLEVVMP